MTTEKTHYTKAVLECCYRVLDRINGSLREIAYRKLLHYVAASSGPECTKWYIDTFLVESGAISYTRIGSKNVIRKEKYPVEEEMKPMIQEDMIYIMCELGMRIRESEKN